MTFQCNATCGRLCHPAPTVGQDSSCDTDSSGQCQVLVVNTPLQHLTFTLGGRLWSSKTGEDFQFSSKWTIQCRITQCRILEKSLLEYFLQSQKFTCTNTDDVMVFKLLVNPQDLRKLEAHLWTFFKVFLWHHRENKESRNLLSYQEEMCISKSLVHHWIHMFKLAKICAFSHKISTFGGEGNYKSLSPYQQLLAT